MIVPVNGTIIYRARRVRFAAAALLLVPLTMLVAWLGYDGILLGDREVRGAWFMVPLAGLFLWLDYVAIAKLIWPPELQISLGGILWSNYAMLESPATYEWHDIEGPEPASGANGVPLLQIIVKETGRKLRLPPSHFGVSYDEMASALLAARAGQLISPEEWRSQHPQHRLRHWLVEWGLPLLGGIVVAMALSWLKR